VGESADIAFNAAFSGEFDEASSAIQKAENAKAPTALTETLWGVSLFLNGQHKRAVEQLLTVVDKQPDHIAANATLGWVYFNQLKHGKHESLQQTYRAGDYHLPGEPSVYEEFFICMQGFVDGSTHQLKVQLKRIDQVIAKKRQWGAAYVLRELMLRNFARQCKSVECIDRALKDIDRAYALLPNSPVVVATALSVLDDGLYLAEANGRAWT
jgi:tetratricopeptide (TPR) repeat protein